MKKNTAVYKGEKMKRATDKEILENYKKFCQSCSLYPCKDSKFIENGKPYRADWFNNNGLVFCHNFKKEKGKEIRQNELFNLFD